MILALLACESLATDPRPLTVGIARGGDPFNPRLLGVNGLPRAYDPETGEQLYATSDAYVAAALAPYGWLGTSRVRLHDLFGPFDLWDVFSADRTADPEDCANYDFSRSDFYFNAAREAGLSPYFRVGNSYTQPCSDAANDFLVTTTADGKAAYGNWPQAAAHIVAHYRGLPFGAGGSACDGDPAWQAESPAGALPIETVEIWNEPSNYIFWPAPDLLSVGCDADPEAESEGFFEFYSAAAQAIRSADPDIQIGGSGFMSRDLTGEIGLYDGGYLDDFVTHVAAAGAPLDFLSWHSYTDDIDTFTRRLEYVQQAADRYAAEMPPGTFAPAIHTTEWQIEHGDVRTRGIGAAELTAMWLTMEEAGVAEAYVYRAIQGGIDDDFTDKGLLYTNGEPRVTGTTFRLWTQLVETGDRANVVVDAAGERHSDGEEREEEHLWVVASADERSWALLVANLDDEEWWSVSPTDSAGTALDLAGAGTLVNAQGDACSTQFGSDTPELGPGEVLFIRGDWP